MFGLHILDLALLLLYLIGIMFVGLWAARKVKGVGDYYMGSRSFSKAFMVMHAFGTGTHTDQAVSVAGASYKLGFAGIWYQYLNLFLTPFYWIVAPLLRRMRCLTTADFFEERFNKPLGIFYAVFGIGLFAFQMGIMLLGTGKTASAITGGAISPELAVGVMTVLFLSYGLAGGLPAAIVTDFIQGIFIIIMSFLIKLVLFPLTKSSFKNMGKMKELQPRMEEIKAKYKDDPKKQQEATMKMYKETGVNPLGGCLPMLLQYPVIIALWHL